MTYSVGMLRRSFLGCVPLPLLAQALPLLAQAPAAVPGPDRLRASIERITRSLNATWAVHVKCLETGEEVALNASQQMEAMSVIKIPIMVETFRQIEAGKFSLTDRVKLRDEDKRPGTGVIRSLDAGVELTVKDLITMMIIVSDNTATDLLFEKVGGDSVNKLMAEYGLTQTRAIAPGSVWFAALRAAKSPAEFHREGKHPYGLSSAHDMGLLLERIKTGKAVSKAASDQMMGILRGQLYTTRLPKYVTGFRVAHKTGDFLPYVGNDVGVFESARRNVIVCVFTANHFGDGAMLEDSIARVGQQVAEYFVYRD
jgi:beta-lactamase class A